MRLTREKTDTQRPHRVTCHLAALLDERNMTLVQLAQITGVTVANLSVLKNGHARAVRYSTLTAVCDALRCQPGDLLEVPHAEQATPRE